MFALICVEIVVVSLFSSCLFGSLISAENSFYGNSCVVDCLHAVFLCFIKTFQLVTMRSSGSLAPEDCGAKSDALGAWQGSTKFGGELLGSIWKPLEQPWNILQEGFVKSPLAKDFFCCCFCSCFLRSCYSPLCNYPNTRHVYHHPFRRTPLFPNKKTADNSRPTPPPPKRRKKNSRRWRYTLRCPEGSFVWGGALREITISCPANGSLGR